jgi:hypothetical protein
MTKPANTQDEFFKALGLLVVEWSHLELAIKETIALCISDDLGLNDRVTANEQLPALLTMLNSLFRYRVGDGQQLDRLKEFRKTVDELANRRNDLMHSHWFVATIGSEFRVRRDKISKRVKGGFEFDLDNTNRGVSLATHRRHQTSIPPDKGPRIEEHQENQAT